jgi:hypothetical protein
MNSGIVVVGVTPGGFLIEDIDVPVPHQVAVTISPDQAVRSKDLYRAINQNRVFKLDGTVGLTPITPVSKPVPPPVVEVEKLVQSEQKNTVLEQSLADMKQKLDAILVALANPSQVQVNNFQRAAAKPESAEVIDVVDTEIPVFIPDNIKPENADAQIESKTVESEGGEVNAAASRLRKLRKENKK